MASLSSRIRGGSLGRFGLPLKVGVAVAGTPVAGDTATVCGAEDEQAASKPIANRAETM